MIADAAYDDLATILITEAERLEREPEPASDQTAASETAQRDQPVKVAT